LPSLKKEFAITSDEKSLVLRTLVFDERLNGPFFNVVVETAFGRRTKYSAIANNIRPNPINIIKRFILSMYAKIN
jgi:hypothetical protein